MDNFKFLEKLLNVEPTECPFVSIYLNAEANETGRKDFDVFLKKQFNDHAAVLEEGTVTRDCFELDRQKVIDYAGDLDPATRGVAIFSNAGQDIFEAFEFAVPFQEDEFFVFDRPHIFPLARIIDQNPAFLVVAADTNSAKIFEFRRAEAVRRSE